MSLLSYFLFNLFAFATNFLITSNAQVQSPSDQCDIELLKFSLNIKYLEAEFFLFGAFGHGLDVVAPELTGGGSSPIGAEKANLQWFVKDLIIQLAYQELGNLRAIQQVVGEFARPLMDLSTTRFAQLMEAAVGAPLQPPFDPYLNDINFLLTAYLFPYISLTSYVGANSYINSNTTKRLIAGLVAVEGGQDAMIRTILYERAFQYVRPYGYTVAEITHRISAFRDQLERSKTSTDDGIIVALRGRNEGLTHGNIIHGDKNSITFSKSPREILRIVYGSGRESKVGGFFPVGANGTIAQAYLDKNNNNGDVFASSACAYLV